MAHIQLNSRAILHKLEKNNNRLIRHAEEDIIITMKPLQEVHRMGHNGQTDPLREVHSGTAEAGF